MRLLCIDHFFEQDIEALSLARGSHDCWSVGYEPFLHAALEEFPTEVATGIDAFFRPEHAAARDRYARRAAKLLDRLYLAYRFDCVCAPSDTFFWIRAVIERCQALGIPFTVLQKEATIPPGWLEGPAREWGQISPFIADHMMVSSDHHAQFWINAATPAEIIDVTGQPRFDIYARPERWRPLRRQGIDVGTRPTVLFLTYDVNAYLPLIDRTGLVPWQQLRDETERVLIELAAAGEVNVLIKGHPQPAEDQTAHLAELGRAPGVTIVDPQADVRYVITAVDAVIGFQTTALLESLSAGRPTIYTWWSEATALYAADLIPFHEEREALEVVRSPAALRAAIRAAVAGGVAQERREAGRALVSTYIGPVDGNAATRCWEAMAKLAGAARPTSAGRALQRRAARLRGLQGAGALGAGATWAIAERLMPFAYRAYRGAATRVRGPGGALSREQVTREIARRRRVAAERRSAAAGSLR
jgi:hypothetical protein